MIKSLLAPRKLVSIGSAAEYLGVSIDTVRRWDKSGILHSVRPDGKNRYFSYSELEEVKNSKPLSISEASEKLGLSASTLRRLESKGLLLPERDANGERNYSHKVIEEFVQSEYYVRQKRVEEELETINPKDTNSKKQTNSNNQNFNKQNKESVILGRSEATTPESGQARLTKPSNHANLVDKEPPRATPISPVEVYKIQQKEDDMLEDTIALEEKQIQKLQAFRKNLYRVGGLIFAGALTLIALITLCFNLFPEKTAQFFGYRDKNFVLSKALLKPQAFVSVPVHRKSAVLGATYPAKDDPPPKINPIGFILRPLSAVSLEYIKYTNFALYRKIVPFKKISNVNDIFFVDGEGKIVPKFTFKLPDSTYLEVPDSGLINNLNADYVRGRKPGNQEGDLAVLPTDGTAITREEVETMLGLGGNPSTFVINANSIGFVQLANSMVMDAETTITNGLTDQNLTINLTGTGDFQVQSNGTTFARFHHEGFVFLDNIKFDGNTIVSTEGDLILQAESDHVVVDGELIVTGNSALKGDVSIGSTASNTVTVYSDDWTFVNDTNIALPGGLNGLSFDGATFSVDALNHRIGIGTSTPTFKLEVAGNIGPDADNTRDIGSPTRRYANIYTNNLVATTISGSVTPTGFLQGSVIFAGPGGTLSQDNTNFYFDDGNNYLGIGLSAPTATLHVAGTAIITGGTTFNSTTVTQGVATFTHVPTLAHLFSPWPSGTTNGADSSLYINPATSVGDGNLITAAVGGVAKFVVDAEGDIYGNNVILTGTTSSATTNIAGDLTVGGNTILGDAAADTITFNGRISSDITPTIDNTYNLGSPSLRWANLYTTTVTATTVNATNLNGIITPTGFTQGSVVFAGAGGVLTEDNANFFWDDTNDRLTVGAGAATGAVLTVGGSSGSDVTLANPALTVKRQFRAENGAALDILLDPAGGGAWLHSGLNTTGFLGFSTRTGAANQERMRIDNNGNMGIGTTAPAATLEVAGNTNPNVFLTRASADSGAATFRIQKARGTITSPTIVSASDNLGRLNFYGYDGSTYQQAASIHAIVDGTPGLTDMPGALTFDTTLDGTATLVERMRITNAGNVGIGTPTPTSFKLEIAGNVGPEADNTRDLGSASRRWANIYGTNVVASNISGAITPTGFTQGSVAFAGVGGTLTQDNANFFWDDTNNRLGLGTATPQALLHVSGSAPRFEISSSALYSSGGGGATVLRLQNSDTTTGNSASIKFQDASNVIYSAIETIYSGRTSGSENGALTFTTVGSGTRAERMRIDSAGNVGIGSTAPGILLDISGAANVSGAARRLVRIMDTTTAAQGVGGGILLGGNSSLAGAISGYGFINGIKENGTDANNAGALTFGTVANAGSFTEKLRIASDGNVGIGTTAPSALLHLLTTGPTEARTTIESTGSTGLSTLHLRAGSDDVMLSLNRAIHTLSLTNGTTDPVSYLFDATSSGTAGNQLYLSNGGNVGIGTTAPGKKLYVAGGDIGLDAEHILYMGGFAALQDNTAANRLIIGGTYPSLQFRTGGTNALLIDSSRNVIVQGGSMNVGNDTTPDALFTVGSTSQFQVNSTGQVTYVDGATNTATAVCKNSSGQLAPCNTTGTGAAFVQDGNSFGALATLGTNDAFGLAFETSGTEKMRILTDGNVGIGTTAPLNPLHVTTSSSGNYVARFTHSSATNPTGVLIESTSSTESATDPLLNVRSNAISRLYVLGNGNVGIGTTAPGQLLELVKGQNAGTVLNIQNRTDGTASYAGIQIESDLNPSAARSILMRAYAESYTGVAALQGKAAIQTSNIPELALWAAKGTTSGTEAITFRLGASATEYMRINEGGNVGIGTTAPAAKLHIFTTAAASVTNVLMLENQGGLNSGTSLNFAGESDADSQFAQLGGIVTGSGSGGQIGALTFSTKATVGATTLSERMRIDSTGNVGIGTTAPAQKLDVLGSIQLTTDLLFNNNLSANLRIRPSIASTATGSTAFIIQSNLNDTFDTSGGASLQLYPDAGAGSNNGGRVGIIAYGQGTGTNANSIRFFTRSGVDAITERMRIASSGNVGIGNSASTALFAVGATSQFQVNSAGQVTYIDGATNTATAVCKNSSGQLAPCNTTGTGAAFVQDGNSFGALATLGTNDAFDLAFETAGVEKMRILTGGNVGIGTTVPAALLEVKGTNTPGVLTLSNSDAGLATGGYVGQLRFRSNDTGDLDVAGIDALATTDHGGVTKRTALLFLTTDTTALGATERMRIDSSGNVGIGTTSPGSLLHIAQDGAAALNLILAKHSTDTVSSVFTGRKSRGTQASPLDVANGDFIAEFNGQAYSGGYLATSSVDIFVNGTFTSGQRPPTGISLWTNAANTTAAERLRITSGGNVGIGTTTPGALLDISQGSINGLRLGADLNATTRTDATLKAAFFSMPHYTNAALPFELLGGSSSSTDNTLALGGGTSSLNSATILVFYTGATNTTTAGTERMRITSAGNVGIGTTAPNEQLEITGNLRLPTTTATTGIIKSGANRFIHNFGTNNTFLGVNAGNLTMTGLNNTGVGVNALLANTTGNSNTALGISALSTNTIGANNTAVGQSALLSNLDGTNNTAIGLNAGTSNTSGSNNIFLGNGAGSSYQTTASNQLIAGSSTTVISNVYFGKGAQDAVPTAYTINGTGGLIGNSDVAGGALQLAGGRGTGTGAGGVISFLTAAAAGSTGTTQNALTEKMRIDQNGNVGIGTTAPTFTLHVPSGTANFNSVLLGEDAQSTNGVLSLSYNGGNSEIRNRSAAGSLVISAANTASDPTISMYGRGNVTGPGLTISGGTTTSDLAVRDLTITGTGAFASAVTNLNGADVIINGGAKATAGGTNGDVILANTRGNVGIGSTAPGNLFSVGTLDTADSLARAVIQTGSSTNKALVLQGSVGQSADFLQVQNSAGTVLTRIGVTDGIATTYKGTFGSTTTDTTAQLTSYPQAGSIGLKIRGATSQTADLVQIQNISGTPLFVINPSGNVGIGVTSPTSLLAVGGNPTVLSSTTVGIQATDTNTTGTRGMISSQFLANPATASSANYYGGYFNAGTTSGNAQNFTATQGLVGVAGSVSHRGTGTVTGAASFFAVDAANTGGGTITNQYGLYIPNLTAATNNYSVYTGSAQSYFGGNVGIGTSAPAKQLTIKSPTAGVSPWLRLEHNSDATRYLDAYYDASTSNAVIDFTTGGVVTRYLDFKYAGSTKMVLQGDGNVGIGTTTPGAALDVSNGGMTLKLGADSSASTRTDATTKFTRVGAAHYTNAEEPLGMLYASIDSTNSNLAIGGGNSLLNAATTLTFFTAANNTTTTGTERMRIDSSGNVGIGTTAPTSGYKLDVAGSIISTGSTVINGYQFITRRSTGSLGFPDIVGNSGGLVLADTASLNSQIALNANILLSTTGNVGLGTATPTAFKLEVAGSVGPDADNTRDLGSASRRWANIYANNIISSGSITATGNILPAADNTYDLGSTTLRWKTLHVGPGSVVVHNDATNTLKATLGFTGSTASLITDAATPLQLTTGTNAGLNINTSGNVGIGTTAPDDLLHLSKSAVSGVATLQFSAGNTTTVGNFSSGRIASGHTTTNYLGAYLDLQYPTAEDTFTTGLRLINGNVGIGTTAPSQPLHVRLDQNTNTQAIVENSNAGINATAEITARNGAAITNGLRIGVTGTSYTTTGVLVQNGGFLESESALTGGLGIATRASAPIMFATGSLSNERMRIDSGGNVGIGTTGPATRLHVNGSGGVTPPSLAGATSAVFTGSSVNSNISIISSTSGSSQLLFGDTAAEAVGAVVYSNSTDSLAFSTAGLANERMRIDSSGNVGIGTTAPGEIFHIKKDQSTDTTAVIENIDTGGSAYSAFEARNAASINDSTRLGTLSTAYSTGGVFVADGGFVSTEANLSGGLSILTRHASAPIRFATGGHLNERMRIDSTGNVGIGTTAPQRLFHLLSSGSEIARLESTGTTTTTFDIMNATNKWQFGLDSDEDFILRDDTGGNTIFTVQNGAPADSLFINSGGNVGIGTTAPSSKLEVLGGVASGINEAMWLSGGINARGSGPSMVFHNQFLTNSFPDWKLSQIASIYSAASTYGGDLAFFTNDGTTTTGITEKMRIMNTGNVGIGTTAPTSNLHVIGAETGVGTNLVVGRFDHTSSNNGGSSILRISYGANGSTDLEANTGTTGPFRYGTYFDTNIVNNYTTAAGAFGNINFVTNGGTKMTITGGNASGNVGIGTTGPVYKLEVNGTGYFGGKVGINASNLGSVALDVFSNSAGVLATYQTNGAVNGTSIINTASNAVTGSIFAFNGGVNSTVDGLISIQQNGSGNAVHQSLVLGAGDATSRYAINGGQNWSVGLDNSDNDSFKISGSGTLGTSDFLTILTGGNVGIGTTAPETKLHITSTGTSTTLGQLDTNLRLQTNTGTGNAGSEISFRGWAAATTSTATYAAISAPVISNGAPGSAGYLAFSTKAIQTDTSLSERMRITETGNVGIGTTAPTAGYKLDVAGSIIQSGGSGVVNAYTYIARRSTGSLGFPDMYGNTGGLVLADTTSLNSQIALNANILLSTTGKVGIGTNTPSAKLHVDGDIIQTTGISGLGDQESMAPNAGFEINGDATTTVADTWVSSVLSGSPTFAVSSTSPVQGTNSQTIAADATSGGAVKSACFPISQSSDYTAMARVTIDNTTASGTSIGLSKYTSKSNCDSQTSGTDTDSMSNTALTGGAFATIGGNITNVGAFTWARMYVKFSPNTIATLKVDGARVTPSSETTSADIAENYRAAEPMEPGEVVEIASSQPASNGTADNNPFVVKSSSAYSTKALGIYSTKPAQVLGSSSSDSIPVALVGRVPVKVYNGNGAIKAGDYLTTSSIPGVAMKATKPGAVIGKALEDYSAGGTGKIMAFVNISYADPSTDSTSSLQAGSQDKLSAVFAKMSLDETGALVLAEDTKIQISKSKDSNQVQNPNDSTIDATSSASLSDLVSRVSTLESNQGSVLSASDSASLKDKVDSLSKDVEILKGQVLAASVSATLAQSDASSSASLFADEKDATLSSLLVTGRANFGEVGIIGDLGVGTLTFDGTAGTINNLGGPLKLQSNGISPVEIMAGKVKIDTDGNLTANEITVKKVNVSAPDSAAASIGLGTIKAGQTQVMINTSSVTDKSQIFVTAKDQAVPLAVTNQQTGTSFTVKMQGLATADVKFNWFIIN